MRNMSTCDFRHSKKQLVLSSFLTKNAHIARESLYPQDAQSWQGAWHAGRPEPRKKLSPTRSFSAPR
jgi:hypothetical protein